MSFIKKENNAYSSFNINFNNQVPVSFLQYPEFGHQEEDECLTR